MKTSSTLLLIATSQLIFTACASATDEPSGTGKPKATAATSPNEDPDSQVALKFDGFSSYVVIPSLKPDWTAPFTLEAWVTPDLLRSKHEFLCDAERAELALGFYEGVCTFNLHNGKKYERVSAAERAKLNERIHVAGVFDGEFMSLFVDGKKQGRTVVSGRPKLSGFPLHLGANPQRKGPLVWQFGGTLHEVRISDSARYREDFERTRRFTPDKRTKALFHFDKGSGSVAYDSSGNNHNGRIHYARWHNSKDDAMYSAMGNASIRVGSEQRRSQAAAAIKATGANLHDSSEYSDWTTISIKYPANAKINVDAALEGYCRKLCLLRG